MEITHVDPRRRSHLEHAAADPALPGARLDSARVRARPDDPGQRRHAALEASGRRCRWPRIASSAILPSALDNFLALLGWAFDGKRELFTLDELVRSFQLERVGSNPAVFNLQKLEWINAQHLKMLTEEQRVALARAYLESRGHDFSRRSPEWIAALVRAIGDRLKTLEDAERYGGFALRESLDVDEAAWAELREKPEVATRLGGAGVDDRARFEFSLASLEAITRALATELGVKAGDLIGLARVALTGRKTSPGIFEVMWLLSRETTVARLRAAAARWQEESPHARV